MRATLVLGRQSYLTVPEVARAKSVTRQCVWAAIKRSALPGRRYGRCWIVPVDALRKWIPEVRRKPSEIVA